jgi:hypothetical protein
VAITPPSDIVLDVARAADPERYRAAVERLSRLRAATAAGEASSPPAAREGRLAPATPLSVGSPVSTTAPLRQPRSRLDAYGQFEAFVLQSFVQAMLPKNATNVYGRGTAGEVWKSMLAEKIGEELARSGQVGIAQRLAAGPNRPLRPVEGEVAGALVWSANVAPELPAQPPAVEPTGISHTTPLASERS